jgi:hypothetical protein
MPAPGLPGQAHQENTANYYGDVAQKEKENEKEKKKGSNKKKMLLGTAGGLAAGGILAAALRKFVLGLYFFSNSIKPWPLTQL